MATKKGSSNSTTSGMRRNRLGIRTPEDDRFHREFLGGGGRSGMNRTPEDSAFTADYVKRMKSAYKKNPELAERDIRSGRTNSEQRRIWESQLGKAHTQEDTTRADAERVMRRAIAPKPKAKKK